MDSVKKTGLRGGRRRRLARPTGSAPRSPRSIQEGAFDYLDAPVRRVAMAEVPLPYAKPLETRRAAVGRVPVTAVSRNPASRRPERRSRNRSMSEIYMPRLSDTMEEGVISSWRSSSGDKVSVGDVLVEIETDKAVMEYEAYEDGVPRSADPRRRGRDRADRRADRVIADSPDAVPAAAGRRGGRRAEGGGAAAARARRPGGQGRAAHGPGRRPPRQSRDGRTRVRSPRRWPAAWPASTASTSPHIQGSGPSGRVVRADVEAAAQQKRAQEPAATAARCPPRHPPLPAAARRSRSPRTCVTPKRFR